MADDKFFQEGQALDAETGLAGAKRPRVALAPATPLTAQLSSVAFDQNTAGDKVAIAGSVGQTIRVYRILLIAAGAVNLTFKRAATLLSGVMSRANGDPLLLESLGEPLFVCGDNEAFNINLSGAVQVGGVVWFQKS